MNKLTSSQEIILNLSISYIPVERAPPNAQCVSGLDLHEIPQLANVSSLKLQVKSRDTVFGLQARLRSRYVCSVLFLDTDPLDKRESDSAL